MDVLAELNPAQKQAVETIDGPLLIVAGPGSGKTRVITHRVAYLIKVCGINPHRIMAVTFTNKAAREMAERLEKLLGQTAGDLTLGTFHAICARILRQEGKAIGLDSRFVIYDEEDQLSLIKQSLQELDLDPKQYTPRAIQSAIKYAKSRLLTPAEYAEQTNNYFETVVQRVYERYQQSLTRSHGVDFDDLLMKTVQLFNDHPKVLAKYQSRYLHILVDEFQDTNITQYMLIKQLAGKHRNVCVVGDPDQSIYSWRFADLRNILSFEKDYPDAKVTFLEQNYRSTRTILDVASSIISINSRRKPKRLWTENEAGVPVSVIQTYNEDEEAQFVISEIERLVSENITTAGGCAVMYRVNAQSRALEETYMRYGMPYKLVGGTRFYQRREIKDVIAYLRLVHNSSDNINLTRIINVPGRGIGQRTLAELSGWAKNQDMSLYSTLKLVAEKKGPALTPRANYALTSFFTVLNELIARSKELSLTGLLNEVLERTGYKEYILNDENGEERWENIQELYTVARDYDELSPAEALATFLEKVSLVSDVDELDEKVDATTLITLHQAKGLEFPVVFIVGMEEGLLPHRRSMEDPDELEEERRLCYVGVTRAQQRVYLLHTYHRNLFGSSSATLPSRFLQDIPKQLIAGKGLWEEEEECTPVTALYAKSAAKPSSNLKLEVGDHVHHQVFGKGVVIKCSPNKDDQEITVAFEGAGVKRLLLSLAPLEKIESS
ncbi:MAG: ATP-dependent DNA helicase PcrA [Chloroflexi bacterium RBG_13_50_10]|nr:MAG: ATP-dependent DNA helicase PcrA [Chloroflexi bacterium RBG_13_50_10]